MQQGRRQALAAMGGLGALLIIVAVGILLFASRWRYETDQPRRSDAIIVLAGDPARARHAAELYTKGYGQLVYVVRPAERSLPPEEEVNRNILLKNGVPKVAIRIFQEGAANTLAEAHASLSSIPAGVQSVLVVTSPNQVRRARMIFTDVLGARGVAVLVLATPEDPFPDPWWSDWASALQSTTELAKAVLYEFGVRYSE